MKSWTGTRIGLLALTVVVIGAMFAASPGAVAQSMVKWTLRESWLPDDLYVPYVIALEKGYYREQGIDFVNQVGDGGATSVKLIATGDVQLGTGESSHVITAIGRNVPVVSVFAQFQDTQGCIVALERSGIRTAKDLIGKRIGGASASSTTVFMQVALRLNGIDPSQYTFVDLPGASNLPALLAGRIDATTCFAANQPVDLEARGEKIIVIPFKDLGIRVQSTSVIVRRDFLEQNRAKLVGFARATIKGTKYAFANPDEAADIMVKSYKDLDRRTILAKWMKGRDYIISRTTDLNGIGWQDLTKWQTVQDVLFESKLIDTKVDVGKAFDNSILTAIPLAERQMRQNR